MLKVTPIFQKSNLKAAPLLNPLKEVQIGVLLGRGLREGHVRVVGDYPLPALPLTLVDQAMANAMPRAGVFANVTHHLLYLENPYAVRIPRNGIPFFLPCLSLLWLLHFPLKARRSRHTHGPTCWALGLLRPRPRFYIGLCTRARRG